MTGYVRFKTIINWPFSHFGRCSIFKILNSCTQIIFFNIKIVFQLFEKYGMTNDKFHSTTNITKWVMTFSNRIQIRHKISLKNGHNNEQ